EGPLPAAKPSAAIHRLAPAGDTSITETICANGFYVFNGDTLRDPGQYSAVLVAADGTDSIVALDLIVLPVSTGMDTVTICAGSTYEFNGEVLSQPGVYESVFAGANGCDSTVTLTLYVLPNSLTKFQAGICTGSSYIFQGDTLTESGFYSVVFPAANGCDSIVILTLDVVPFFDVQLKASICAGENFVFNGDTLHAAGSYTDSLQAAGGCDSIVTLTLKVLPVPTTELTAGICTGSEYHFQGDTLEVSGTYRDTLTAANGCDSLVILHLSVVDFFDVSLNVSICTGETYVFGADSLDTEGVYVHSLVAAGGCDSTVTLALTILPVQTGTAAATICQGDTLDYNGQLLTIADVYKIILTGANGCDSTVTLTLTVKPTAATALQATICQGAIYDFNGEALDSAGTHTAVLDAANGCDSTVTLQLTVLPVQQTNIPATICPGGAYPYNGDLLTATGNYPYVFVGANGCDSIVTIALTVLASPNTELNVSICSGDGYIFNGSFYTQTGTYTAIFTAVNGCDSTATLHLEVLPVQNTSLSASICVGTDYIFHGDTLDQSGVYTGVFTGGNGCDSTVTLSLTVLPTHSSTLTAITCANEPYLYNGQSYMTSGTYPIVLTGPNGCDSTVTLVLTVRPVFASAFSASICAGEVYLYNGDTLTASGTFTYFLHAVTGCDSVVTLQLTVRPLPSSHATVNLCQGGAYVFDGDTLTTSGTYVATHPGANGCDSTATLELNFAPFFALSVQATICNGEGYLFGGDSLHTEGIYVDSLLAGGGCDSIVTLTLTVLPVKETTTVATICSGGSYQFNGQAYTQSGLYPVKLIGVNGCDSTVTLNLIVLPVPVTNLAATICAGETYPFNG
ncbi:MAG: hypothetical protein ABIQ93_01845, partial [Saprospiraceae bacterium]